MTEIHFQCSCGKQLDIDTVLPPCDHPQAYITALSSEVRAAGWVVVDTKICNISGHPYVFVCCSVDCHNKVERKRFDDGPRQRQHWWQKIHEFDGEAPHCACQLTADDEGAAAQGSTARLPLVHLDGCDPRWACNLAREWNKTDGPLGDPYMPINTNPLVAEVAATLERQTKMTDVVYQEFVDSPCGYCQSCGADIWSGHCVAGCHDDVHAVKLRIERDEAVERAENAEACATHNKKCSDLQEKRAETAETRIEDLESELDWATEFDE